MLVTLPLLLLLMAAAAACSSHAVLPAAGRCA